MRGTFASPDVTFHMQRDSLAKETFGLSYILPHFSYHYVADDFGGGTGTAGISPVEGHIWDLSACGQNTGLPLAT